MAWLYTYGDVKPVVFRLVDSGGNKVTGHTFLSDDLYWSGWNGSVWSTFAADGLNVSEVGRGFYMWTPSAASKTQYEIVVLDILDSAASTFIDNAIIVQTGGNAAAYQDG
jgi:hypothetical protein